MGRYAHRGKFVQCMCSLNIYMKLCLKVCVFIYFKYRLEVSLASEFITNFYCQSCGQFYRLSRKLYYRWQSATCRPRDDHVCTLPPRGSISAVMIVLLFPADQNTPLEWKLFDKEYVTMFELLCIRD